MSIDFSSSLAPGPSLLAVPSLRLADSEERVRDYIDKHIVDWAIQEILDPTKRLATTRGHAQKFIDALSIVKFGPTSIALAIDHIWGPNQIPLHDLLENGWGEGGYDIESKNPELYDLAWTGGKYGPGYHYAPKVRHPGFAGYHIVESVYNWGFIDKFESKVADETTKYMEEVRFR